VNQWLTAVRDFDRRRQSFPGEHLVVAALGTSLVTSGRNHRDVYRVLATLAGIALLVRAASGRDGLARLARSRRR